jgi:hypothetical protein
MEALPRRDYNRRLWRQATDGLRWKAHLVSAGAAVAAGAIQHLISGAAFEAHWSLVIGVAAAAASVMELAQLLFRRFVAAPYELYQQQLQQSAGHEAEMAMLRGQARKLPRPQVTLTYAVESLNGFEDEVSNPPIVLHNDGDTAALEAQIDALQLSPLIKVTFATVQRISAQETTAVAPRVEIRTESGGWELGHNDKHFGLAIQRAHVELTHRGVKTSHGSRQWPMIVRYHDPGGASYSQSAMLTLHVPSMKAWTVFVPPE